MKELERIMQKKASQIYKYNEVADEQWERTFLKVKKLRETHSSLTIQIIDLQMQISEKKESFNLSKLSKILNTMDQNAKILKFGLHLKVMKDSEADENRKKERYCLGNFFLYLKNSLLLKLEDL